jgi:hypothetical protein
MRKTRTAFRDDETLQKPIRNSDVAASQQFTCRYAGRVFPPADSAVAGEQLLTNGNALRRKSSFGSADNSEWGDRAGSLAEGVEFSSARITGISFE